MAVIIFKVTVTVKVGKTMVKAVAQFFNCQISDAFSVHFAEVFANALSSVLLQNSLVY